MKNIIFSFFIIFSLLGCSSKEGAVRKAHYAKPVVAIKLENFHKVDEKVYRSAQPDRAAFREL